MALILAIEPDRRQARQLTDLVRGRVKAELVLAENTESALGAIGNRVPDLILVPTFLSPQEDAALAGALRIIATAARVEMLTIPVLAERAEAPKPRGLLSKLRRRKDAAPTGCDPAVFAEQIATYLSAAKRARDREVDDRVIQETATPPLFDPPIIAVETPFIAPVVALSFDKAITPPVEERIEPVIEAPLDDVVETRPDDVVEARLEDIFTAQDRETIVTLADETVAAPVVKAIEAPAEVTVEAPLEVTVDARVDELIPARTEETVQAIVEDAIEDVVMPLEEPVAPEPQAPVFFDDDERAPASIGEAVAPLVGELAAEAEEPAFLAIGEQIAETTSPALIDELLPVADREEERFPAEPMDDVVEEAVRAAVAAERFSAAVPGVAARVDKDEEPEEEIGISPSIADPPVYELSFDDLELAAKQLERWMVPPPAERPSRPRWEYTGEQAPKAERQPESEPQREPELEPEREREREREPEPERETMVAAAASPKPVQEPEPAAPALADSRTEEALVAEFTPAGALSQADLDLLYFAQAEGESESDAVKTAPPPAPDLPPAPAAPRRPLVVAPLPPIAASPPTPVKPEPVVIAPQTAAASTPPPAKPEWVELIESLRQDVERLRAERTAPAQAAAAKKVRKKPAEIPLPPRKHPRPTQDQWGLFDPEQCGFAALLSKLEEITDGQEDRARR